MTKKEVCGAILTDLSKVFDCISHDLLIAKLNAYGFNQNALNFIHNYLFGRSQKTKVGSSLVICEIYIYIRCTPKFGLGSLLNVIFYSQHINQLQQK